jgi:hypothetical protein
MARAPVRAGWRPLPDVVVRTTAVPWEALAALSCPASLAAARGRARVEAELERLRSTSPRLRRPSRATLARLRAGRELDEGPDGAWLTAWNAAVSRRRDLDRHLADAWARESAVAGAALRTAASDPWLLLIAASSNPGVHRDLAAGRWSARLERQVGSLLQRLCAKNETTAFFGPINYGTWDETVAGAVRVCWSGPRTIRGQRTHPASWLVLGLATAIALDPEVLPWLVLRRKSFAAEPPGACDEVRELLGRLDGSTTLEVLRRRLGWPAERMRDVVGRCCRAYLATHQVEVPPTAPAPLHDLLQRVAAIPAPAAARHAGRLLAMIELMERYGAAGWAGRRALGEELLALAAEYGVAPPAGREQFYGDRLALREDCLGDLEFAVCGERAAELRCHVAPALDVLTVSAVRRQRAARAATAARLGRSRVPLWRAVAGLGGAPAPTDPSLERGLEGLPEIARRREVDLAELSLDAEPDAEDGGPLVCSLDLMVCAESVEAWAAGGYELVLGDLHDTALLWGWPLQFHSRRETIEARTAAALAAAGGVLPVVSVLASRRTGLPPLELPGPVAQLGGVSGRANPWVVPFDDLAIESDGRSCRLLSAALGSEVRLRNGELPGLLQAAFGLPQLRLPDVNLGRHTPRLRLGRVIVQRERWTLSDEDAIGLGAATDDRARLEVAARIWDRNGLPDLVFVRVAGQRKPVLVDVASPPLVAMLARALSGEPAVASEVRPGPDELWLHGPDGRHTAEIRSTWVRG